VFRPRVTGNDLPPYTGVYTRCVLREVQPEFIYLHNLNEYHNRQDAVFVPKILRCNKLVSMHPSQHLLPNFRPHGNPSEVIQNVRHNAAIQTQNLKCST